MPDVRNQILPTICSVDKAIKAKASSIEEKKTAYQPLSCPDRDRTRYINNDASIHDYPEYCSRYGNAVLGLSPASVSGAVGFFSLLHYEVVKAGLF